jgi:hypothetical protein
LGYKNKGVFMASHTHRGQIDLYSVTLCSPETHNGTQYILIRGSFGGAHLTFLPRNSKLKDNVKLPGVKEFRIYYYIDAWDRTIDILRNETPAYFYFNEKSQDAMIYTGDEPVGEEET